MPRASIWLLKPVSIDGIAIPKEILWGGFEREGFQDLLRCPGRRGMSRDVEVEDATTVMCQNDKNEENLEPNCWHSEEVHRSQLRHVIVEKGSPGLRGRTRKAHLVLGDSRLGYVDAQLQQFTVDSRCSPEWIGPAHLLDYLSRLSVDLRSTESRTALPSPVQSKAFTMPSHNSSGLHNDETRSPIRPEPRQSDPDQRSAQLNLGRVGNLRSRTAS
jgi:hypothetical protein